MKLRFAALTALVSTLLWQPINASADGSTFTIEYNQNVQLQYGAYAEVELALKAKTPGAQPGLDKKRIYWEILQDTVPEGMELEESESSRILVFGTPKYTDKWCFVAQAIAWDNGDHATASVCLKSNEHPSIPHPRFKTARDLKHALVRETYSNKIAMEPGAGKLWVLENIAMPEGLTATLSKKGVDLKGKLTSDGVKTVAVRVLNDKGYKNSMQFVLEVFESQFEPPTVCPIGYAWESYYQDCIPVYDAPVNCFAGQYWSEYDQQCLEIERPNRPNRPIHRPRPPRPDHNDDRPIHRPPPPPPLPPQDRPDNPDRPIHTPPPPSWDDDDDDGPSLPPQDRPDVPDRPIHTPPPPSYDDDDDDDNSWSPSPPSHDDDDDSGPSIPPQDRPDSDDRPIHRPPRP